MLPKHARASAGPAAEAQIVSQLEPMAASVSIRVYEASDIAPLVDAVRESIPDLLPWMPWASLTYSSADAENWVRLARDGHGDGTMYDFAVFDEFGRYAGGCGLNRINVADGVANLGYWVRSSTSGRGIAPSAVRQVAAWAFACTRLHRLEIVVALNNVRSLRVAEKVGAQREAVLRKRLLVNGQPSDAVLFSIVRSD